MSNLRQRARSARERRKLQWLEDYGRVFEPSPSACILFACEGCGSPHMHVVTWGEGEYRVECPRCYDANQGPIELSQAAAIASFVSERGSEFLAPKTRRRKLAPKKTKTRPEGARFPNGPAIAMREGGALGGASLCSECRKDASPGAGPRKGIAGVEGGALGGAKKNAPKGPTHDPRQVTFADIVSEFLAAIEEGKKDG